MKTELFNKMKEENILPEQFTSAIEVRKENSTNMHWNPFYIPPSSFTEEKLNKYKTITENIAIKQPQTQKEIERENEYLNYIKRIDVLRYNLKILKE